MFRLFQNPQNIPFPDINNKITLIVGLNNIAHNPNISEIKSIIRSYIDNKLILLLMPTPKDKYIQNKNTIHNIRKLLDSVCSTSEEEYVKLIEDFNIEINDYNIIITPLYTNFNSKGLPAKYKYQIKKLHPDFSNIEYMQQNLEVSMINPDNIISEFNISYKYIINHLKSDKKNIIFTIWSPVEVQEENDVLSVYSSNSLKEFIKNHQEIESWISINNPSYSDFKIGDTSIYCLERDKETIYDYDVEGKILYYISEIKTRN